jgi:hypothetical protein
VLAGEVHVGEHVFGGVLQELRRLWVPGLEHPSHVVQLGHRAGVIGC